MQYLYALLVSHETFCRKRGMHIRSSTLEKMLPPVRFSIFFSASCRNVLDLSFCRMRSRRNTAIPPFWTVHVFDRERAPSPRACRDPGGERRLARYCLACATFHAYKRPDFFASLPSQISNLSPPPPKPCGTYRQCDKVDNVAVLYFCLQAYAKKYQCERRSKNAFLYFFVTFGNPMKLYIFASDCSGGQRRARKEKAAKCGEANHRTALSSKTSFFSQSAQNTLCFGLKTKPIHSAILCNFWTRVRGMLVLSFFLPHPFQNVPLRPRQYSLVFGCRANPYVPNNASARGATLSVARLRKGDIYPPCAATARLLYYILWYFLPASETSRFPCAYFFCKSASK